MYSMASIWLFKRALRIRLLSPQTFCPSVRMANAHTINVDAKTYFIICKCSSNNYITRVCKLGTVEWEWSGLPLQSPTVQFDISRSLPSQTWPPFWGAGLSHCLRRCCLQSKLHFDHDDHVDHWPSTKENSLIWKLLQYWKFLWHNWNINISCINTGQSFAH